VGSKEDDPEIAMRGDPQGPKERGKHCITSAASKVGVRHRAWRLRKTYLRWRTDTAIQQWKKKRGEGPKGWEEGKRNLEDSRHMASVEAKMGAVGSEDLALKREKEKRKEADAVKMFPGTAKKGDKRATNQEEGSPVRRTDGPLQG